MGFGIGLILAAAGAVLAWGVHTNNSSVNVNTIGVILLIVGIIGMLVSLVFWSSWAGPGGLVHRRVVRDDVDTMY